MKCSNEGCTEDAIKKIIHVGSQIVFYCENHLNKYCCIMTAMGAPQPAILPIMPEDDLT